jgi:hypothetical protein
MVTDILTIVVIGVVAYLAATSPKSSQASRVNILLVVLILISANIHGAYVGVDQFRLYVSAILEGLFGGILIKRLSFTINPRPA